MANVVLDFCTSQRAVNDMQSSVDSMSSRLDSRIEARDKSEEASKRLNDAVQELAKQLSISTEKHRAHEVRHDSGSIVRFIRPSHAWLFVSQEIKRQIKTTVDQLSMEEAQRQRTKHQLQLNIHELRAQVRPRALCRSPPCAR